MQEGYELQWTVNEIIKDIEEIQTRLSKYEFTSSQIKDIEDALELAGGEL